MADSVEIKKRPALSGWPMIVGWIAMLIFAGHACTHMVGAGDTWVAMACGRHFLNHGVDTVEPFSANSHHPGPIAKDIEKWPGWAQWITEKVGLETVQYWNPTGWVNQNWLTHVIFYWLTHESPFADADTFSFNSLVYWKFAVYILTVICIYYTGRLLGVNPALSAVFTCFAIFIGRSFFDIRPAGFSNLLTALYLLVLVFTTYKNVLYIWLIVPIAVLWCNLHGGYIYLFIMLVPFVALNLLTSFAKKGFVSIGLKGVYHTIAAGFAAFIAIIVFNPFHLTNITHTFVISLSKHAEMWRQVNEWHPAFEWRNPVGDEQPFLYMYILGWLLLPLWIFIQLSTSRSINQNSKRKPKDTNGYQWPKADLALMVIAALTIYMAVRSRRFIPIAAIAACPILAMFIDQIVRSVSAVRNFHKENRLYVSDMSENVRLVCIVAGVFACLFFGSWWGLKFKRVYLDPWPTDEKLTSVFMRMTASNAKPFYALKFIRDNKISGKMFNYWTEGGFVAWGQEPDPGTGKTPLQLFMDGRAQAAYEPKTYIRWSEIMAGGRITYQLQKKAKSRGRKLNNKECKQIGEWISGELRKHDVWLVLMPAGQFAKPFVRGIERCNGWTVVFINDKQKIFVDVTTPKGKELFDGIGNGRTVYPDEFSRDLILAHYLLLSEKAKNTYQQGLNYAIKAFKENSSQAPIQLIILASRFPELRPKVKTFCRNYLNEFVKNKGTWSREHGYHNRIVSALVATNFLKDTKMKRMLGAERNLVLRDKRW